MLIEGWMVNLAMRRVERVVRMSSPYNRLDYGKYQGPKRAYMLHNSQVFGTELAAAQHLFDRMCERYNKLSKQLRKYSVELDSVAVAVRSMEKNQ